jgi:hypothetical protein
MDRSPGKGAAPKHGTFSTFKAVDVVERLDAGTKAEAVVMVVRRRMVDNIIMVGGAAAGKLAGWVDGGGLFSFGTIQRYGNSRQS